MSRLVPTRWSHLIGYSGVGALVRADDDLYVVKDIRDWTDRDGKPAGDPIRYVELLRATLAIDRDLRQPPLARELDNGAVDGTCVPAWRFPGWTRCPSCGRLHWLPRRRGDEKGAAPAPPKCSCERHPRLQQVAWVVAHPEGGLAEVPWHFLAHRESRTSRDCRRTPDRPYLRLRRDWDNPLKWTLSCDRCGARATFRPNEKPGTATPRRQPWERHRDGPSGASEQKALILEVNDPRLYFPRVRSGLVIPPESRARHGSVLDLLYASAADRAELERCRSSLARKSALRTLADRHACRLDEIEAAWNEIDKGYPFYDRSVTPGDLSAKEYQALTEPIPDLRDSEDFVTRHKTDAWRAMRSSNGGPSPEAGVLAAVNRVIAVTRLREVRIFTGFSRVTQNFDDGLRPAAAKQGSGNKPIARLVPPDLDGSADWLPAVEFYGEGVFFTLDEGVLSRWGRQAGLEQRTEALQRRFERTGIRFPDDPPLPLTPRFLLLHTLAHLLIRQLETGAGYPAASLRERIYCADGADHNGGPMAGILVYVAVPDVAGSLGGLAELAEPERFLPLLAGVFEHAEWCSLDPVCGEHQGQGPSQLNLAACHACALVPEPSCAFGNLLLDRTFVKGDLQDQVKGLLAHVEGN